MVKAIIQWVYGNIVLISYKNDISRTNIPTDVVKTGLVSKYPLMSTAQLYLIYGHNQLYSITLHITALSGENINTNWIQHIMALTNSYLRDSLEILWYFKKITKEQIKFVQYI